MIHPGLYQHYKGDLYWVEGVATDSTNGRPGAEYVFYVSLANASCHVRRRDEFQEVVQTPAGPAARFRRVYRPEQIAHDPRPSAGETDG